MHFTASYGGSFFFAAMLMVVHGVALAWWGWHGRCRDGERQRLRWPLGTGVILIALAAPVGDFVGLAASNNMQPRLPLWWLRLELALGEPWHKRAKWELAARIYRGHISEAQLHALIESMLRRQIDLSRRWPDTFGFLLENAQRNNRLSPEQQQRFLDQVFGPVVLDVRPRVRQGDPLPYRIRPNHARSHVHSQLRLFITVSDQTIGQWRRPEPDTFVWSINRAAKPWSDDPIRLCDSSASAQVGAHHFTCRVDMVIRASSNLSDPVLWSGTSLLSAAFEVVPRDHDISTPQIDESARVAMESITLRQLVLYRVDEGRLVLSGVMKSTDPLPLAIAHELYLRSPDGRQLPLGKFHSREGLRLFHVVVHESPESNFDWTSGTLAGELLLRPKSAAAAESIDVFSYWGDEVRLKDVQILDGRQGSGAAEDRGS